MGDVTKRYDLNADVGEGFSFDAELLEVITSANVACGFHAGDDASMRWICHLAAERGVAVGAQVSYRDRDGFGRRDIEVDEAQLVRDLTEQVEALQAVASATSTVVSYLKPHGALYNRAVHDAARAQCVVSVAKAFGLPVLGLPGSVLLERARAAQLTGWREFFADRAYDADGRLVPRALHGAVIDDPAMVVSRVSRLVRSGTVETIDGHELRVDADSICVHGDSADAGPLARAVRVALGAEGATVAALR
jgi:5-oxoprolinase (ATP-hydrolysing) subunit A